MKLYYFEGSARLKGAIGITYPFNAEVKAETLIDAITKLYDNYEHISIDSHSECEIKDVNQR
jgi:hypothetical protein